MSVQASRDGQLVRQQPTTQLATTPKEQIHPLVALVGSMRKQMEAIIPKHLTAERMARLAVTALRTTKDLDKCTPASFLASLMGCAMLGLEPNTPLGQAYLLPFYSARNQCHECQLVIGYQGYLDLARRSGLVSSIQAFAVYKGDSFEYELGLNPTLRHRPSEDPERENGELTHAYCVIRLKDKDAEPVFLVMPRAQIEKRKNRGAAGKKGRDGKPIFTPWSTDYEAMALKTVARATCKWAPRSTELATAMAIEDRVDSSSSIAPALPDDVRQHLLDSGHVEREVEPEPEHSPVNDSVREPGQEG